MTHTLHRGRSAPTSTIRSMPTLALLAVLGALPAGCEGLTEGTDAVVTDIPAAASFPSLYDRYLYRCKNCHAPGALAGVDGTEATLDFTSAEIARASLAGTASGLVGNQEACNGVSFLDTTYETSLLAAVLDYDVRAAFSAGDGCDVDAISDMTLTSRAGPPPGGFLDDLAVWINDGTR